MTKKRKPLEQLARQKRKPKAPRVNAPKPLPLVLIRHEGYLAALRVILVRAAIGLTVFERQWLGHVRIAYGAVPAGELGACHHGSWFDRFPSADHCHCHGPFAGHEPDCPTIAGVKRPLVNVNALEGDTAVLLAVVLAHELAHVLTSFRRPASIRHQPSGHGPEWRQACRDLGHLGAKPELDVSKLSWIKCFKPEAAALLKAIPEPNEGRPLSASGPKLRRICSAGAGANGGQSRGKGSGSRQLKWQCIECGQIVRAASKSLRMLCLAVEAHEDGQAAPFILDPGSLPAPQAHMLDVRASAQLPESKWNTETTPTGAVPVLHKHEASPDDDIPF